MHRASTVSAAPFLTLIAVCDSDPAFRTQLATLRQFAAQSDIECILVDDRPAGSDEWTITEAQRVEVLRNRGQVGCSLSRNRALGVASGEYVVFLNPGVTPAPGWLEACRLATAGRPDIVVGITRAGVGPSGPRRLIGSNLLSNVLMARRVLIESGSFPPFLRGTADLDLIVRLAETNPTVYFDDQVAAYTFASPLDDEWRDDERLAFLWRNPLRSLAPVTLLSRLAESGRFEPFALEERLKIGPAGILPGVFCWDRDEVARCLAELVGLDSEVVGEYLKKAVKGGLLVSGPVERAKFDIHHSFNWLRAKTYFLDHELRHASFARTHPTPRQLHGSDATPTSIHCRGAYTVTLPSLPGRCSGDSTLTLSLPVDHRCQSNIKIIALLPSELEAYVDRPRGVIGSIPLDIFIRNNGVLGYEFECDITEPQRPEPHDHAERAAAFHRRYLRRFYPPLYQERAARLLEYILAGCTSDPETDLRRIYRWIVENLCCAPTLLPDYAILDAGTGNCISMARLFITLSRLRGVPAREQCGALLSRALSDLEVLTTSPGYSPFTHTWAEVYLEGRGWSAVEFVVMCFGPWRAKPWNTGQALRAELIAQSERLLDYYFGNVDPYRIYSAQCSNRVPTFYSPGTSCDAGPAMRHRLLCSLS